MGAEWGFQNALVTSWYPGNSDEATQQTLGPQEVPSHWEGQWKRTLMGKAPTNFTDENGAFNTIVDPHVLADTLEDFGRVGFRLRVTWIVEGDGATAVSGKKVREGRIKDFKAKYTRLQDIDWEITFEWLGRGRTTQRVLAVRDDTMTSLAASMNAQASNLAALQAAAAFIASNSAIRLSASNLTLGQLETLANAPYTVLQQFGQKVQQVVSRVKQATDIASKLENLPFAVANKGITAAQDAVSTSNAFVDQMGQVPPEQMSLSSKVSDLTRAASFYAQNKAQAALLSKTSQDFGDRLRARQSTIGLQGQQSPQTSSMLGGDIVAIHITKTGDTPQKLSQKYYQSPDHGSDILRANKLPLYQPTFPPGKPLIIPVLQALKQGA